jgi:PAS domain S-box-containing protein
MEGKIDAAGATLRPVGDEFFALADNLPVLCWMAYADGHIFWYNRRWYAYTGTSPESQEGWGWQTVHDPDTLGSVLERWRRALITGKTFEMTFPLRGADGVFRPFLTRAVPVLDSQGAIIRWYGTNVDISEQVAAEAAARASEARFRLFTDAMPNQVWTSNAAGHLDWFNPRVYEYSGASVGELDGEGWVSIVHPEDLPRTADNWSRALSTGVFYETEFRLRRRDGVYRWFIARAFPITGADGRIVQWIGTNTDIDDHKRVTQSLHESERRLALSQSAAGIASLELDIATGTVIGSEGFWDLWGLEPRHSVHISVLEQLVVPEDAGIRSNPETRKNGTAVHDVQYRVRRADNGELRWLWRSIDFVRDAAGTPVKMFGVMQDITERKAMEHSLRESEARYKSALQVGRMGSWETNFASGERRWSPEGQELFGLSLPDGIGNIGGEQDEFQLALHPDDRHLIETFHHLADTVDSFPAEYRIVRDGTILWISGRGQVFSRGSDGKCQRLVNVVADVSDRKRAEEHVRFLMGEMSHRSKNFLSVIQAIARRTVQTSSSMAEFQKKFEERLRALAASNDILLEQNRQGAALAELVARQLTPFVDPCGERFELSGADVYVNANAAQAIGLALHELATNAVKYGALSVLHGKVSISWTTEYNTDIGECLILGWVEKGGPVVTPPSHNGFGAEVIGRMAPASLSARVALDYASTGLCWTLTIPMASLTPGADSTAEQAAASVSN